MRCRLSQITLCITAAIISSCSQIDRTWDNPVDPLESQKKAAAPNETPTPEISPTAAPAANFAFKKFALPILSDKFDVKADGSGSYSDTVIALKSAQDDAISFLSLERSKSLSQFFWRLNARKYRLTEDVLAPWSGSSEPTNLFPECNDPVQGNGVLSFRVKGIVDKYQSPAFSADSMPDYLTHVKVEVDCKSSALGASPVTISKVFRLSDFGVDSSATARPFAADSAIKCVWPNKKLMVDNVGRLFDYQFQLNTSIGGNFSSLSAPLYLGAISECFESNGKLLIKTSTLNNSCYSYDYSDKSLITATCAAGKSILSFQPFSVFHVPFDSTNSRDNSKTLYHIESLGKAYKVIATRTGSQFEIKLVYDDVEIPFGGDGQFGNILAKSTNGTDFLVQLGKEQSYKSRIFAWSKDRSAFLISNPILTDAAVVNARAVRLTVDSFLQGTKFQSSLTITGTCIPRATVTVQGPDVSGGNVTGSCSSSGSYSIPVSMGGSDGMKFLTVTDSGISSESSSVNGSFVKDTTPPTITIGLPSATILRQSNSATYSINFSDVNSVATVSNSSISLVTTNGVVCSKSISGSFPLVVTISNCTGDGTVGIRLSEGAAVDTAGNRSSEIFASSSILVDNTPPVTITFTLIGDASDGFVNANEIGGSSPIVSFFGLDSTSQMYAVVDSAVTTCSNVISYSPIVPSTASLGTVDGSSKRICVKAIDVAGNESYSISPPVTLDKSAPSISFSNPSLSLIGSSQSTEISMTMSDTISGLSKILISNSDISLIGATAGCVATIVGTGNFSRSIVITGCSSASGSVTVGLKSGTLVDYAGNKISVVNSGKSFGVRNSTPLLTLTSPSENLVFGPNNFSLTGTCESGLPLMISGDVNQPNSSIICPISGNFNFSIGLFGADGSKVISLSETNSTGGISTISRTYVKDATPPAVVIENPSSNFLRQFTTASYVVRFSDSNGVVTVDKSKIGIKVTDGVTCSTSVSGDGVGPFTVSISNCSGEGNVGISVLTGAAWDIAGNVSLFSTSAVRVAVVRNWYQEAYIKPSNASCNAYFGGSVSLSGDLLAVGASRDGTSTEAISNGDNPCSNNYRGKGAVYLFRRTAGEWAQEAYIKSSNLDVGDYFGVSVSLSGETLAVGAYGESSNQTVITNGTSSSYNNDAPSSGAVYVYRRIGETWVQEAYIKAINADSGDFFGIKVALDGDNLAVGAMNESSNQKTIISGSGASNDNSLNSAGSVYLFSRNGPNWAQSAYIKTSNAGAGDQFGSSLSISGDTLVVGAPFEDSAQNTITNGQSSSPSDDLLNSGAAYVYRRNASVWTQEAYIKPVNLTNGLGFGHDVSLSGDTLVVGVPTESSSASQIINGTSASFDTTAQWSGAAYVYRRSGVNWLQEAYIKASNSRANSFFGYAISVSGGTLAVGATREDSYLTVITNGGIGSTSSVTPNTGAVYLFKRDLTTWFQEAFGKSSIPFGLNTFGNAVSLSGDSLAVGNYGDSSGQNFITNGSFPTIDFSKIYSGSVSIFRNIDRLFDPSVRVTSKTATTITLFWPSNLGASSAVKITSPVSGTNTPPSCNSAGSVTLPANSSTYTFSDLTSNTKYGFRVCAFDGANTSQGALIWDDTLP